MSSSTRLAAVLSDFARTLLLDVPVQRLLDDLVLRTVDLLPIDAAGVTLIAPDKGPRQVAGSSEAALVYEQLQTDLDEGPCRAVFSSESPVLAPDLKVETRWPRYAEHAGARGLRAVFAFPMRSADRRLGALDLYCHSSRDLSAEDQATAQTLADVATAYLLNAESRTALSDFVASVSHELRTPITSLNGYIELLQDPSTGPLTSQQRSFVEAIERNSQRATRLADNLLHVAALDSGAERPRETVNLVEVIRCARDALEPTIVARSLAVDFHTPTVPVWVHGIAEDLERVVVNLVGNAMKFTDDGGWVRLVVDTKPADAHNSARVRVEVSDNGMGIPHDELPHLFTRFFRSHEAKRQQVQGTGLGLNIVESIVRQHGGEITVRSAPAQGSTFIVDLPGSSTP